MMQNYQKFTRDQNFKFLCIFEGVIVEKLKGGLTRLKFWSLAIKIICNKKVQNSVFVSAALHDENGSKSEKWDFLLLFAIFAKGFKQNSMN